MSDSTGRRREEHGHRSHNISLSKYVSQFLDVPNKSRYIENLIFFDAILSGKAKGLHMFLTGSTGKKMDDAVILVCPFEASSSSEAQKKPQKDRKKSTFKFRQVPKDLTRAFVDNVVLGSLEGSSSEE